MQDGRSVHAVLGSFWIFLAISFSHASGETLFHWTDDTGRSCYSNVSPPAGVKAYSANTVSNPVSDQSGPAQAFTDTDTTEKLPAETGGADSDFSAALIKQRIMDRKISIGHIKALLRKHPNDPILRKSLLKKKQYLFEDLTRMKNVR